MRASRASSTSRVSMSAGISIPKTRNSPDVVELDLGMARRARRLPVGGTEGVLECGDEHAFLDALLPLDRLNALDDLLAHVVNPSSIRLARTIDVVRDVDHAGIAGLECDGVVSGLGEQPAIAVLPSALDAHRDALADGVGEVLGLAERTVRPRRGDLDRVLRPVGVECVRHTLAERVVDAVLVVDVDTDPARRRQLDREDTRRPARATRPPVRSRPAACVPWRTWCSTVYASRYCSSQQKWARRAHFVKPVKCGAQKDSTVSCPQTGICESTSRSRRSLKRGRAAAGSQRLAKRHQGDSNDDGRCTAARGDRPAREHGRSERDGEEDARLADGGDGGRRGERQRREDEAVRREGEDRGAEGRPSDRGTNAWETSSRGVPGESDEWRWARGRARSTG